MTRRPVSVLWVVLGASLWMAVLGNGALWRRLVALDLLRGPAGWSFALGLWVLIWAALVALLGLLAWRATLKPAVTLLLLVTAVAGHFMRSYGVLMDTGMLVNTWQTDAREAGALLSGELAAAVAGLAVAPAWLLWRQPLAYGTVRRQLWRNPAVAAGAAVVLVLAGLAVFQPLSSTVRNHKDLRYLVNPMSSLVSAVRVAARPWRRGMALPVVPIGEDARIAGAQGPAARPRLLLLVLGETARSDHFGLNGYERPTTPALEREGVVSFRNAWACGTSTAESVPCMFSHLGRSGHGSRDRDYEGLLDVLQRAGLAVLWLDNQSGCKGVCDRVPHAAVDAGRCPDGECFDEAMLDGLDARIAALDPARRARGIVLVMHQMGSHGPAYHRRSPPQHKPFLPECTHSALQDCRREELVNAYDNSIAATDHFLAQAIGWLRRNATQTDNALVYVSDHGESLGENRLYLHGMPYAIAPDAQKHVPWITWLGPGFARAAALSETCLRGRADAAVSHDHYFHSVLGLMDVATALYRPALDAYAPCRGPAVRDMMPGYGGAARPGGSRTTPVASAVPHRITSPQPSIQAVSSSPSSSVP